MPTQIRAKSTDRANRKKIGGDSVVRSCCGTLKGMVLGFECCFVRSTYRANESQHRNCVDLDITQSLNQAFGRSIDFHHALNDFSGVPSNDEGVHLGRSLFKRTWRDGRSAYHGILHKCQRSRSTENHALRCRIESSSFYDNSC